MAELVGFLSEAEQLDGVLSGGEQLTGQLSLPIYTGGGLTDDIKEALLDCFEHVAWIDDDGQQYYDALLEALYPLSSITAVYTQSGTVYTDTSLDSLKDDLVVTAHYGTSHSETVTTYTLSGTLTVGTSIITVTYEGKATTFNVTVSEHATLSSISAVYTQSGTVYPSDSLDSLKSDLVVTAHYSDTTTATVASSDYTLSGTLTVGTSTITVTYEGKTTTFNVTVTQETRTLVSISAVYTQSGTVYDTDSLDSLKTDLVVTATYDDTSTETVPSTDYTLSGTLTAGTSTITVSYEGKSTTFTVTVTASNPYVSDGLIMWLDGIKNGTNGAHETTLATWVDQTGNGWNWTNSNATVAENSVVFNGTNSYLYRAYQSVPANAATVEIVAKKTRGGCILTGFGRDKVGNMNIPSSGNNLVFHTSAGSGADKNTAFDFGTAGEIHSANSSGYLDGQAIQSFVSSAADWQYEYPSIGNYLGSGGNNPQYPFTGEIYCIRLYNRVLTQQEILANYAADVARFGIGGA